MNRRLLAVMAAVVLAAGCVSRPAYIPKTTAELVAQCKAENPPPFPDGATIPDPGAAQLVGEWEGMETTLCQVFFRLGGTVNTSQRFLTYQFFPDGTCNTLINVVGTGVSSVLQGTWAYEDGALMLRYMKDDVLHRLPPTPLVWRSATKVEVRNDVAAFSRHYRTVSPGAVHALETHYDADGYMILESDQDIAGDRTQCIQVQAPLVLTRVGDVAKPSLAAGMNNPVIHDEALKAEMERQRLEAEARMRESEASVAMTQAIAQGITAVGDALAQPRGTTAPAPQMPQAPIANQGASQPQQTTVRVKKPIGPTKRVVRPPSFIVGEYADGTPKMSDQSWRDGKYK